MATLPDWRKETTWADAVSRLGADHVAWILQQDNPAGLDLKRLSIAITEIVCGSGFGCTYGMVDRLDMLRRKTGMDYDAINDRWSTWTPKNDD